MSRLLRLCLLLPFCFVSSAVAGEDVAKLAQTATETLRSGNVDTAIEQFDAAFSAGEPTLPMLYNKAIAHFRKGETEIARQLFAQAGDDPKLTAKARYNLGNTDYADAIKLSQGQEPDPNAAIGKLQSAISHYRRSLAMDRSDADARANIELAHKLMRQLQQQQQQEQPQQNQQQDDSKQDQNQQQDQQQSDSQNKDQKSQDQTSNQTPNDTEQSEEPSEQDGNQDQQQQSDEQSEDGSEQQQPEEQQGKQQQQNEQQQNQQQDSQQQQQNADKQSEQQKAQQDSQDQSASDEEQTQPESDSQGKAEQPEGELKPQNAPPAGTEPKSSAEFQPGQRMTQQEARKMLQAVRDRDFRRRLEKLRRMQTRRVRVEKDW